LTFIIPAEIFPTCYRCTCHGISAASGKVGSIIAVLVIYGINKGYTVDNKQGLVFLLFATFAAIGAIFSWAYLPDVQRWVDSEDRGKVLETKNLEDLGEGREKARQGDEVVTIRDKFVEFKRRRRMTRVSSSET
jgi:MFS transporter, PHS family, inorganic phosphate transporter